MSFNIYKNLAWLNDLTASEAEGAFFDCCKSPAWVSKMATARPFAMVEDLFENAERTWFSLPESDRREAFTDPSFSDDTEPLRRVGNDHSGAKMAVDPVIDDLAEARRLYKNKFGFTFVVNENGKMADELVLVCRARLGNSHRTELTIATEQQYQLIEIRLRNLLEK